MSPLLLMLGQVLLCGTGKASGQREMEPLEERRQSFSRGWKGRLNKGGMREVINMKVVAKIQNTSVFPAGGTPGAALSQPGAVDADVGVPSRGDSPKYCDVWVATSQAISLHIGCRRTPKCSQQMWGCSICCILRKNSFFFNRHKGCWPM